MNHMTRMIPLALRCASTFLLIACTLPIAHADIGPKPTQYGSGPRPMGKDMDGIDIAMAAEQVELTLRRKDDAHATLDVVATFHMRNDGDVTELETGFPFGAFNNVTSFRVVVDGSLIASKLVNRNASIAKSLKTRSRGRRAGPGQNRNDYWYVWTAPYAAKKISTHVVTYSLSLTRPGHQTYGYSGYTLHSGAPWKGPIGRGTVTLRCADGMTLDHCRRFEPLRGATRKGDAIVWSFNDLEPTRKNDIRFNWASTTWEQELAAAKKEAETRWSGRYDVALHWERTPDQHARTTWTKDEAHAFASALQALVDERTRDAHGKIVLPAKEPRSLPSGYDTLPETVKAVVKARTASQGPATRQYVGNPRAILRFLAPATRLVAAHGSQESVLNAARALAEIYDALKAGKLYAGDKQITVRESTWNSERMKSIHAARTTIETHLRADATASGT